MKDSDDAAEAAFKEWREQNKLDELSHALDHVLSGLDLEPWDDYKTDPEFIKVKIDKAIAQIKFIQKEML